MPHIEIAAEKLVSFFGFPITNALLTSWIVVGILVFLAVLVSRHIRLIPAPIQNMFEIVVEGFLGLMEGVLGSRKNSEKYLPLVGTLFLFIVISNWLGIFPGVGSIGIFEGGAHGKFVPLLRSAASDINVTLALATITVILVNVSAIHTLGVGTHLSKYFSFKGPIEFFVGILEFISEFAKIISFSFRLFGNIFAGEVLLVITGFLAPYGAPVPFLMLEVFVGFIQALVFAMLTTVFISIAVAHH
ncbi:MAG: ATP synthase, subunit A [Parcubacteria group bacterium Gr01-1014_33]|nr:MAG: ATP synthase, subunit A [Parcubacteria group bacterium Gr01-1014_33]